MHASLNGCVSAGLRMQKILGHTWLDHDLYDEKSSCREHFWNAVDVGKAEFKCSLNANHPTMSMSEMNPSYYVYENPSYYE